MGQLSFKRMQLFFRVFRGQEFFMLMSVWRYDGVCGGE
jgi:hypothetical protein